MTNKEILYQAIEKAEKNGFKYCWERHVYSHKNWHYDVNLLHQEYPVIVIFSHEFAKAFFGGEKFDDYDYDRAKDSLWVDNELYGPNVEFIGKAWQYHLQQIVLKKEPLKYLEKFL